jgi:two-component system sensor histidine kinase DegS
MTRAKRTPPGEGAPETAAAAGAETAATPAEGAAPPAAEPVAPSVAASADPPSDATATSAVPPDEPAASPQDAAPGPGVSVPEGVSVPALADQAAAELEGLERELAEIGLLVTQARTEAGRQETRRAQGAEKLAASKGDANEAAELATQLVTLTKRASVMEAQVEVLEGKQRALTRYRDALAGYAAALRTLADGVGETWMPVGAAKPATEGDTVSAEADAAALPPAISRVVLAAQEDLRREIARSMHDGPAQSLTNIVLQAQIVDRLLDRDPAAAKPELALLVGMVQQTLEATKSFIFDVRPMVLDDLGLVPTLRRTARERGRRAGLAVGFDSVGMDRRLGVDTESALFRIVDEALAAFIEREPERIAVGLDWGERLRVEVSASRASIAAELEEAAAPAPGADVPPALAAMIEDRRARARASAPGPVQLPATTWREIQGRARTIGATAELLDDGGRLVIETPLPENG